MPPLSGSQQAATDYSPNRALAEEADEPASGLPEFDIDIRLDQDLTEYAERSRHARTEEADCIGTVASAAGVGCEAWEAEWALSDLASSW